MKVRAKKLGYYGLLRRKEGEVFNLQAEEHFSKSWMEKVDAAAQGKSKGKPKSKQDELMDESEAKDLEVI